MYSKNNKKDEKSKNIKLEKEIIYGEFDKNSSKYGRVNLSLKNILQINNLSQKLFYTIMYV